MNDELLVDSDVLQKQLLRNMDGLFRICREETSRFNADSKNFYFTSVDKSGKKSTRQLKIYISVEKTHAGIQLNPVGSDKDVRDFEILQIGRANPEAGVVEPYPGMIRLRNAIEARVKTETQLLLMSHAAVPTGVAHGGVHGGVFGR